MTLRTTSLVMLLAMAALPAAAGCDDSDAPASSDLGLADLALAASDQAAPATPSDLSATAGGADLSAATGDLAAPQQGPTPLIVDGTFAASGFEGGGDVAGTITDDQTCPMRGGDGRGVCHHVAWTPGTNSWGGVLWQYPSGNWGTMPGFAIPAGYGQVRFRAWGKTGGESVSFLVGLGADGPDKFQGRLDVTLAAVPTVYVLGVGGAYRDHVVSGFGWVTGAAAAQTFYIDDIVWTGDDEGSAGAPPALAVEPTFGPTGYMGDGSLGFVTGGDCAPAMGGAGCRHFEWDPNSDAGGSSQGWAGVFWQSAPGNWGGASDPAGAAVAAGYREVRFRAWSTHSAGDVVSFLAGISAGSHDGWQSKLDVQLATTPTVYSLGVGGGYGANVVGGFGWVAGGGAGRGFDIDSATWR